MRKAVILLALCASACTSAETARLRETTKATYDKTTGKLRELTYDSNKNGRIDTWTEMDGARPVRTRIDRNEDGRLDRWETYDERGQLQKVGFSRRDDGKPDAWAYSGAGGTVERIEISSAADEAKIDRWEHYDASGLRRAEEDGNGDGRPDKWETYQAGALEAAAFDENRDGTPDRRLTYDSGRLISIETEPDAAGNYQKKISVG